MEITLGQPYNIREKPTVILYTYINHHAQPPIITQHNHCVVVVFILKTVLTSIRYLLFLTLQGKETNFRGHKLTQNKVQKDFKKKTQRKSKHLARKIIYRFLKITSYSEKQEAR